MVVFTFLVHLLSIGYLFGGVTGQTENPTLATMNPTIGVATQNPTLATMNPTVGIATENPTLATMNPTIDVSTLDPTMIPTNVPTMNPTNSPKEPCCLFKRKLGFVAECLPLDIAQCRGDKRCKWCNDEISCGRFDLCGIMGEEDIPTANPTEQSCCLTKRRANVPQVCNGLSIDDCRGESRCKWCQGGKCNRIDECDSFTF